MHGAAQGVWKYMTTSANGGREEVWEWKLEASVMSVIEDMIAVMS